MLGLWISIAAAIGLIGGVVATYGFLSHSAKNLVGQAKSEAERIRETARKEAETLAKEVALAARQEQVRLKEAFDKEHETERRQMKEQEQRLAKREDTLDRKLDTLTVKERNLDNLEARLSQREKSLAGKEKQLDQMIEEERQKLLQITGLTPESAKEMLLHRIEDECRHEAGALIQRITEQAQEEAKEKSRQIILQAIQRYAAEQTCDHTVSTVAIPSDDMKGRVIGREGRNIRSFEKATGVDVIIDDTPGVVVVSCFDPVRREIARISLERLVQDGRIHPARIEELVTQTTKEMDEELMKIGKEAVQEANIPNIPKPIIPMLGRLGYRTSYGQNVLRHSLEVAYIAQVIADELGLDGQLARRCGLLHDIGKAMDHETEGGHPQIGKDFLRRFNESEAVLNATEGHHGDVPATTPYTPIIMAADAISASRPGARRESLERYIKRLQDLEQLATGFEGVRQAYAIQAGREVRVIVDAKTVDDAISNKIARDIAKKIEDTMTYPGEIKVTLIREVRSVEYAR
ncbi:MAG TPA: ribonuclease Y [Tepidisphaeraceae bacterium]|jgi:ribonuclease Y|nr:ribonuclease Y [Tepidisphaeraceae bacterium]